MTLRAVLSVIVLHGAPAAAQPHPPPQPAPACPDFEDRQHLLGADVDFGGGHVSSGLRYLHAHRSGTDCGGLDATAATFGYGVALRTNDLDAGATYAIVRASTFGHSQLFALEGGYGTAGDGSRLLRAGFFGIFFSFQYVDLGATYHFPVATARPAWLHGWQFALRIYVPIFTYARSVGPRPPTSAARGS